MPPLDNQPTGLKKILQSGPFHLAYLLLQVATFAFIVYTLFTNPASNKTLRKYIDTEIKKMQHQVDSASKKYVILSIKSDSLQTDISKQKEERQRLINKVEYQTSELTSLKNKYETISHYTNIPVDSLRRIFSGRFDH